MIKIIRYSNDAFTPKKQDFHFKYLIESHLYGDYNKWSNEVGGILKDYIIDYHKMKKKFYEDNLEDFKEGIWAFYDGVYNDIDMVLNHLNYKPLLYSAYLPDDVTVYDTNWNNKITLTDGFGKCPYGIYVPKRSLINITNIERI